MAGAHPPPLFESEARLASDIGASILKAPVLSLVPMATPLTVIVLSAAA